MSVHEPPLRVLLTGATGLVGSSLLVTLLERGHSVLVIGRRRGPLACREPTPGGWRCSTRHRSGSRSHRALSDGSMP
jgi:nucleoside-diphosphate-sugar epimerase